MCVCVFVKTGQGLRRKPCDFKLILLFGSSEPALCQATFKEHGAEAGRKKGVYQGGLLHSTDWCFHSYLVMIRNSSHLGSFFGLDY